MIVVRYDDSGRKCQCGKRAKWRVYDGEKFGPYVSYTMRWLCGECSKRFK